MSHALHFSRKLRLGTLLIAGVMCWLALAASAQAAPVWRISAVSQTTAPAGGTVVYHLQVRNVGAEPSDGSEVKVTAHLPDGFVGVQSVGNEFECPSVAGESTIVCSRSAVFHQLNDFNILVLEAAVPSSAAGIATATFVASGGGGLSDTVTADPVRIEPAPAGSFGLDAFDAAVLDENGGLFTHAGGHPDSSGTSIDLNTVPPPPGLPGLLGQGIWPAEPSKDIEVDLPPGAVGNASEIPRCSLADLSNVLGSVDSRPLCLPESQIGITYIRDAGGEIGPVAVYSVPPAPGQPARFGFNIFGTNVLLGAKVRNGSDYGLTISAENIPEGLALLGNEFLFWGNPAGEAHDFIRSCPGEGPPASGGLPCESAAPERPFLRAPTSCGPAGEGLRTTVRADSWFGPGAFVQKTFFSHEGVGYPWPEEDWGAKRGTTGCPSVQFDPSVEASPTTNAADSPTGLDFDLTVPQDCWQQLDEICQSDLRGAEVDLPSGMTINPAAASGLAACTMAEVGYEPGSSAPFEFNSKPASCPDASKIGSVEITTPLLSRFDEEGNPVKDGAGDPLPEPLTGSVYLAKQSNNPAGSLFAMYLVVEGAGVVLKQVGEVRLGPDGRLTTVFRDAPQQPFSNLHLQLFGGPRAPLRTPAACGTYTTTAELTPWSDTGTVERRSSFTIDEGCGGGFDPQLSAGTANPLAGSTSPFNLRLTREDGTREIIALTDVLPPGLSGYLKDVPYCSDAALAAISGVIGTGVSQEEKPSCPAASRVGTITVGAGAGPNPFYTGAGRAYLAGPYKGAPLSIAAVVPAVAGPFDLGTSVVRTALRVNPDNAQITAVSDQFPTILHGIPVDLRDVRFDLDRPNFTLNPTNCEPLSSSATIAGTGGVSVDRSVHFQAAGCDRLGFKPKLTLSLKGPVHRGAHPALSATYTTRPGDANLARAQVKLPPAAFLDQSHIGTVCTRVQFAAHACPPASIYGKASATSPILGYPVSGNVYLRSSSHKLPDLVVDLRGPASQPIEVALVGKTDSVKGALRNTFEVVPDAPVTKFHLRLFGKKRGLIEMSNGFCAHPRATIALQGQNGRTLDTAPAVRAACGKKSRKHKK